VSITAGNLIDDHLEAETLRQIEYLLPINPVMTVAELAVLVASPREEFGIALFNNLRISIKARVAGRWLLLHFLFYNFKR
jgi:hypothetical protein